jgi:hypothetical protein
MVVRVRAYLFVMCHELRFIRFPVSVLCNACASEADHMAAAFMMQSLKGSSCTVNNARQYFAIFR